MALVAVIRSGDGVRMTADAVFTLHELDTLAGIVLPRDEPEDAKLAAADTAAATQGGIDLIIGDK